ncbi:MAG TPA: TlpA disulfide reductase family protein [Pyrinomonadaceae bacterium]|nr:TlpA disulfide reductase family protein [Pyrinomonadaceae bacterium]
MKKILLITSIVLCLSSSAPAQTAAVEAPKFLPEEVTGSQLRDLSGRAFRLKDFRGRVYVVNLWATWCGPCRLEIPGFNKIYEDYRARGVEFVGLTAEDPEESSEKVSQFVGEFGMNYRVGWIDRETVLKLTNWNAPQPTRPGSFAIPQTFVVAADGHVVLRVRGYNPRVPEMVRAGVRRALELSPAPKAPAPPAGAAAGRP